VNFLENNEATRLKAEQSQKVDEWDSMGQLPCERPRRPLFLLKKASGDPSSLTYQQVCFALPQWTKRKGKLLFPRGRYFLPLLGRKGVVSLFLCVESYCFPRTEVFWSLLYSQRCLFRASEHFKAVKS